MAATSHRRSTADVIKQLVALVTAVTWMPAGPNTAAVPAFDRVELFDSEQLAEAFRYLLVAEQRVCVIVPLDEKFDTTIQVRKLICKRELPVMLLISDRVLGNRKQALLGDLVNGVGTTPGAMGLAEFVMPAVTGLLLPNPAAVVGELMSSQVLAVRDIEKDLPARVCVGLELRCRGGYLEANDLPAGAVY